MIYELSLPTAKLNGQTAAFFFILGEYISGRIYTSLSVCLASVSVCQGVRRRIQEREREYNHHYDDERKLKVYFYIHTSIFLEIKAYL